MIVCFKCSAKTKNILDKLLEGGNYKDYSEIISLALSNLEILHREIAPNNAIIIGAKDQFTIKSKSSSSHMFPYKIPDIFLTQADFSQPDSFAQLPRDEWGIEQEVPLVDWIFGQQNKLLPAKANCRALVNLLQTRDIGIRLEDIALEIAKDAAILGSYLFNHDKKNHIDRDHALSTAFPLSEVKEKSLLRYINQFLAGTNSNGQLYGLLLDLKLINYKVEKSPVLHLTEVGWRFGTMPNPILDSFQENPTQKFSDDEISYLLNHIINNVPVEKFTFKTILQAILDGANRPDSLDTALEKFIPKDRISELSKSFISTQRSGAVSRMSDLGLVQRIRNGIKVSYAITDKGTEYLNLSRGENK